ncbi:MULTISPECIES: hypothetical protein [Neisseria]|uniref:hypothetical protein n=1 Tax=Neisseria TaxID=482 RepID=UPI000BB5EF71|nr:MULTISPECIES: hypothetical protein [Neisseria]
MNNKKLKDKELEKQKLEDFECWLWDMPNTIDSFMHRMPREIAENLDFSIKSLDIIEKYLLDTYQNSKQIMDDPSYVLDGYAVYVGETFIKILNDPSLHWELMLDEENVYYNLPVIKGRNLIDCPLTMITTCLHRRKGVFLSSLLTKFINSN